MGWSRSLLLAAALLAMLAAGSLVRAQAPALEQQQAQLEDANEASAAAAARSERLARAAEAARGEAAQARAEEVAAQARIAAAEADIVAASARIAITDRLLTEQRARLAERQGPIVRLVAAIQSLARRPPALGLVQPGSTEDLVHVRAVLGATLPHVRERTAAVRAELERVRDLRAATQAAVARLRAGRERLEQERVALVALEAEHRLRSRQLDRSAMIESDRAIALGERARDIVDQMEVTEAGEEVRADLAALPGPLPRPGSVDQQAGDAQGAAPYRLPVAGTLVRGLGELSDTGVRARGLTLEPFAGALVSAPAAGRVLYADRFRSYGGVVILDHGEGWTTLISGLEAIGVRPGRRLAQGAELGRAARGDAPRITVELRRRGQPMDITALLD